MSGMPTTRPRHLVATGASVVLATATLGLGLAAARVTSAAGTSAAGALRATAASVHRGSVDVLYAASLENVMNKRVAAAFHRATGYTFSGYPAGSTEIASEIRGRVRQGDVFISAATSVNATLEGRAHGDWVSWYAPFATTSLVLGYNRSSSFAKALRSKPWYRVLTEPGLRLGFTDPRLDPKGVLTVDALRAAARRYHLPALDRIAEDQSDLFPEEDLVGRLQAGQLDAGFFYTVEASAARIPTVSLRPIGERATFTITVLNRAPHAAAAQAFVKFLLSQKGAGLLRGAGLATVRPVADGRGVPAALGSVIHR